MIAGVTEIVDRITHEIVQPLIVLLFAFALILFLWGGFNFIRESASEEGRETGKRNMLWGIVGMIIMVSVLGILRVLLNTFDISNSTLGI